MFRVAPSPIIRNANNCIYSIWYLSHRYCYLPLSWKSCNWFECAEGGVLVCAASDGWWYHPKHVEQFPDQINCVTLHLVGYILEFRVCNFVHHHTFKWINQLDAVICQVHCLSFKYSSTCFGHSHAHHQELNNCSSSRHDHDQQHCYHHVPTVNQRLLLQSLSSWWWAWGRSKHVELYLKDKQ
jgi:hypothetical protein